LPTAHFFYIHSSFSPRFFKGVSTSRDATDFLFQLHSSFLFQLLIFCFNFCFNYFLFQLVGRLLLNKT
jgi:hypothetical protein